MRRFIVEPGGFTFYHTHDFEHEVYILAGEGIARAKDIELKIKKDMAILVIPNEVHQFINNGNEDFVFLCIIPN
ncbi:MAG: cupin domain-containing protein [Candidatus Marinimicrobia bacterium]|nr:cupin domain-containing protein [Candidatus Neomarinimicrobiota bacterium]